VPCEKLQSHEIYVSGAGLLMVPVNALHLLEKLWLLVFMSVFTVVVVLKCQWIFSFVFQFLCFLYVHCDF